MSLGSSTIRLATAHDAAALAALRGALFRKLGEAPLAEAAAAFEERAAATFVAGIGRGHCFAWLAETEAGHPVGSVALLLYPRLPTPDSPSDREGYLLNVYTVPEWRSRGVASALVAAAVAKGRELGMARIRLHATAEGRPLYAAAGFVPRDDEMELRLTGSR